MAEVSTYPTDTLDATDFLLGTDASGNVKRFDAGEFGQGGGRELLTVDRTYYVRTDGSNSNTGLANTAGGAWLTLQHAMNVMSETLDFCGFAVTISIGAGSFAGVGCRGTTGGGRIRWIGAGSANTTITAGPSNDWCFGENFTFYNFSGTALHHIDDLTMNVDGNYHVINWSGFNIIGVGQDGGRDVKFTGTGQLFLATGPCAVYWGHPSGAYAINRSGGSASGREIESFAPILLEFAGVWTITGSPTYGTGFFHLYGGSKVQLNGSASFVGSWTGINFHVDMNSVLDFNGAVESSTFNGSLPGLRTNGGRYFGGANDTLTVATLPSASGCGVGATMFVSDSNATLAAGLGATVAGGGTDKVPVYSDGTNWKIG